MHSPRPHKELCRDNILPLFLSQANMLAHRENYHVVPETKLKLWGLISDFVLDFEENIHSLCRCLPNR